eukprot:Selendium_serpulae@DN552_c0_g1_i1.p1
MPAVEPSGFVERVATLLDASKAQDSDKGKGSVWITFKRHSSTLPNGPRKKRRTAEVPPDEKPTCLLRVQDGKKKYSAQVAANDATRFSTNLNSVMRPSLSDILDEMKEKEQQRSAAAKGQTPATPQPDATTPGRTTQ